MPDSVPIMISATEAVALERQALSGPDTPFNEAWVQQVLFKHPECLPLSDLEPAFGDLISICCEMPTAHGPIDNLFMTATGDVVIAEVKLWRNPQARREVIAQALDYASCLFEMSYEEFEKKALQGSFGPKTKPKKLYDVFAEHPEAIPEASFIDAVTTNLRRGRIVVLVVGDGIRAETERLASALQAHAGFHFTFGLVELAVYAGAGDALLVVPRTLAKTVMIERGIVRIDEKGKVVVLPPVEAVAPLEAGSISAEQFYEAMASRGPNVPNAIRGFLDRLGPTGVYPDFQRSLNLKWDPPEGKSINLGYIKRNGEIWHDMVHHSTPDLSVSRSYIQELANAWNMTVDKEKLKESWTVRSGGKAPRIEAVADELTIWAEIIERFVAALRTKYTDA